MKKIMNLINKEIKSQKTVQLEDEFVIAISEDINERFESIENEFDSFILLLSNLMLKKVEDIDYQNMIENYKELNDKISYYSSTELTVKVLDSKRELIDLIQERYAEAIYRSFAIANCLDKRKINLQYKILNERFMNKTTQIIETDINKYNEVLLEKHEMIFKMILKIFQDFETDDINEIQEVIKRYSYIADSKELERIAIEKGYTYKHTTGSHFRYEHKETHKVITIPHHNKDMGYGLSLAIQKQIDENAVA